jgi:ribonuclease R
VPRNRRSPPAEPLPDKAALRRYIAEHPGRVDKRDIARHFGISGDQRIPLKAMLRELLSEGTIVRGEKRRLAPPGALPEVAVIEVTEIDEDGRAIAKAVAFRGEGSPPRILVEPDGMAGPALGPGDRLLARLKRIGANRYEARPMRRLAAAPSQVLGIIHEVAGHARLMPTNRKDKDDYAIHPTDRMGALRGELVLAEVLPGRKIGLRQAKVIERLGDMTNPRAASLIAIHQNGIPTRFSDATVREAAEAKPVTPEGRVDLRDVPLITIDPEDARDHDDAVFATPDGDGWRIIVAIADVAHYVQPDSALDKDARLRGNSTYLPDRVVPMLPHELSSDLCSLLPDVDRACMAVTMWLDRNGNKKRHQFVRGIMRSAANVNYAQVQAAFDGKPDAATAPILEPIIKPLYAAYAALAAARDRREPLAIEMPELKVELDAEGKVQAVRPRPSHESNRLIEAFMIAANVAAAEELERLRQPCIYRVHEVPTQDKLEQLREFLSSLGIRLAKGQVIRPELFNRILAQVKGSEHERLVNEVVLRSQTQAVYSPDNLGHFGLQLGRYAHFTSPIRRYADLLVHRGLIAGLKLGSGALTPEDGARFSELATHISNTERRSMQAEREAVDRYLAAYLAQHVGAVFHATISGVTRFGLFVELDETGANGLIPIRNIGPEFYRLDEAARALIGDRSGVIYRLGQCVRVKLAEADQLTGSLRFDLYEELEEMPRKKRGKRR